jgi:hypothetical protein
MSSPTIHDQARFQTDGDSQTNLDRCNRCGELRSAHGPEWSCPASGHGRTPVIWLTLGSLLAVAGLIIVAVTPTSPSALTHEQVLGTLGEILLAAGVTTAVAAAVVIRRRNQFR